MCSDYYYDRGKKEKKDGDYNACPKCGRQMETMFQVRKCPVCDKKKEEKEETSKCCEIRWLPA